MTLAWRKQPPAYQGMPAPPIASLFFLSIRGAQGAWQDDSSLAYPPPRPEGVCWSSAATTNDDQRRRQLMPTMAAHTANSDLIYVFRQHPVLPVENIL